MEPQQVQPNDRRETNSPAAGILASLLFLLMLASNGFSFIAPDMYGPGSIGAVIVYFNAAMFIAQAVIVGLWAVLWHTTLTLRCVFTICSILMIAAAVVTGIMFFQPSNEPLEMDLILSTFAVIFCLAPAALTAAMIPFFFVRMVRCVLSDQQTQIRLRPLSIAVFMLFTIIAALVFAGQQGLTMLEFYSQSSSDSWQAVGFVAGVTLACSLLIGLPLTFLLTAEEIEKRGVAALLYCAALSTVAMAIAQLLQTGGSQFAPRSIDDAGTVLGIMVLACCSIVALFLCTVRLFGYRLVRCPRG